MKISEIFSLNLSQAELDFVDIDIDIDTPLFLDPFFIGIREDNLSISCARTIRSFFQSVIDLIMDNRIDEARNLFRHLEEPNSTCLGLSKGTPHGKGVGPINKNKIFDRILNSRAIHSGLLKDLEDSVLFVENFDKDRLSDMTTNIIRMHLIEYTVNQCILNRIPLTNNVASGYFWNRQYRRWENTHCSRLVIQGRKILLVPKGIVSYKKDYTANKYYQHFVLNFLQNENLELNTALVQRRSNGIRYVTKESIKDEEPFSKEFLREFTRMHPEVLEDFKNNTSVNSLTNLELVEINIGQVCEKLINNLHSINAGSEDANRYHKLIKAILEFIFYPMLINPVLEKEINKGRKRIDISFDNAAIDGIFYRLSHNMNLPCQYIMIECKNYNSDPANPELDQLSGRFSPNRGKVGFLLCRNINNSDLFLERCVDTYKDERGLIIPLTDSDLIEILENYSNWNQQFIESKLSRIVRRITLS